MIVTLSKLFWTVGWLVHPLFGAANRETRGMILFFITIFGGPILLLLIVELVFGMALDRFQIVRRRDSPREYWYLLIFHSLVLIFVVGVFWAYLFYSS